MKQIESNKLTVDDIKECEKHILESFATFCEKNNLSYYLTFGTLIGAVRHQGFIPWDDDIDVAMPRPDYNRLKVLLDEKNGFLTDTIQLKTPYSKSYQYPIFKMVDTSTFVHEPTMRKKFNTSVWIDIFPIDALPRGEENAINFVNKIETMRKYYFYTIENHFSGTSLSGKFKFQLLKLLLTIPYEVFKRHQQIDRIAQKYSFQNAEQVAIIIDSDAILSKISISDLEQTSVSFEGRTYTTFKNYDSFLRTIFHDYMQLPPEDQRIYKHGFDAYRV